MSGGKSFDEFDARRYRVKEFAKIKGIPLWKLAAALKINDGNLSRRLRNLTEIQAVELCGLIDELSK